MTTTKTSRWCISCHLSNLVMCLSCTCVTHVPSFLAKMWASNCYIFSHTNRMKESNGDSQRRLWFCSLSFFLSLPFSLSFLFNLFFTTWRSHSLWFPVAKNNPNSNYRVLNTLTWSINWFWRAPFTSMYCIQQSESWNLYVWHTRWIFSHPGNLIE